MRISDWSSDVCSSDLRAPVFEQHARDVCIGDDRQIVAPFGAPQIGARIAAALAVEMVTVQHAVTFLLRAVEIAAARQSGLACRVEECFAQRIEELPSRAQI